MNEGFQNIILEGDAWNVIESLKKSDVTPHWSIRSILDDILFFVHRFSNVEFSFVHRMGNVSTHLLAQWAALVNWSRPVPSPICLLMFLRLLLEMGPSLIFLCLPCFGLSFLSNKVFIQPKKKSNLDWHCTIFKNTESNKSQWTPEILAQLVNWIVGMSYFLSIFCQVV